MTARPLSAQHRNRAGYDRYQSRRHMHGDKRQKERSIRREGKTGDIGWMPGHCLPNAPASQVSRLNETPHCLTVSLFADSIRFIVPSLKAAVQSSYPQALYLARRLPWIRQSDS
jgi:hypothetical protein